MPPLLPVSVLAIDAIGTRAATGLCAALFAAATPAVFINNSFRVTGLAVDANPREIAKRFAALKHKQGLHVASLPKPHAHPWELPATPQQLWDAEHRLQSPEHRLIDEIFWFWPVAESGSPCDAALHAVAAGDYVAAEKVWKRLGTHPVQGPLAVHNLAIRWHLTALRFENHWKAPQADDKAREALTKCWLYALKRWDLLLGDDVLWARIEQRIRALNDSRMSPNVIQPLRQALPWALASINGALAIAHTEAGEFSLASMHIRLIRDNRLIVPAGQYAKWIFDRAERRLRHILQTATTHRPAKPLAGLDEVRGLVHTLTQYERLFAELGWAESPKALELIDQGLGVCMVWANMAHQGHCDYVSIMSLMERALPLAKGSATRALVQRNLAAAQQGVLDEMLAPLYKTLAVVNASAERPAHRYAAFERDVLPLLTTTVAEVPLSVEAWTAVSDAAARALRTISIDAWTKDRDALTAAAALKDARTHALSDALRNLLYEDSTRHTELLTERNAAKRKRLTGGAAWCAGAVLLSMLAIVVSSHRSTPWVLGLNTSSWSKQSAHGVFFEVSAADESGQIDRVRNDPAGELAGGQNTGGEQGHTAQQLEADYHDAWSVFHEQELEADNLEQQAREQSMQLDVERRRVNNSDPSALEDFHSKEDYFNSLVHQASAGRAAANALADSLKSLSQRVHDQHADEARVTNDHNAN